MRSPDEAHDVLPLRGVNPWFADSSSPADTPVLQIGDFLAVCYKDIEFLPKLSYTGIRV
jgi:hypothetical protein